MLLELAAMKPRLKAVQLSEMLDASALAAAVLGPGSGRTTAARRSGAALRWRRAVAFFRCGGGDLCFMPLVLRGFMASMRGSSRRASLSCRAPCWFLSIQLLGVVAAPGSRCCTSRSVTRRPRGAGGDTSAARAAADYVAEIAADGVASQGAVMRFFRRLAAEIERRDERGGGGRRRVAHGEPAAGRSSRHRTRRPNRHDTW